MENQLNRTLTLSFELSKLANNFGYKLEADEYEDVFHQGYSVRDVLKMDLSLSSKHQNANKLLPSCVAIALEDAERSAWAELIVQSKLNAFKEALLKIDLSHGGAEYQDMDGNMVSAKAGISNVEISQENDTVEITVYNPEHLINAVVNGRGYFHPDLSIDGTASVDEIKARFHNLNDFFEVYGESKPDGDVGSQSSPSINDDYFTELLQDRIDQLSLEEVAEEVIGVLDYESELKLDDVAKLTGMNKSDILSQIKKTQNEKNSALLDKLV